MTAGRTTSGQPYGVLAACLFVACNYTLPAHDGGAGNDAAIVDAIVDAVVDAPACPGPAPGAVGGPCSSDPDCESTSGALDGLCLTGAGDGVSWPATGYCVSRIGGCGQDGDCGGPSVCVDVGAGVRACMLGCAGTGCECPDGMLCGDGYVEAPVQRKVCVPGNRAAIDGAPCVTFGDCDEASICRADPFEHPGGQCMQVGCVLGDSASCDSGGDALCAPPAQPGGLNRCLDACDADTDCREAEGYVCFDPGNELGRYCRHPVTGDPCTLDSDCGAAAVWACKTGVDFPGGYCTIRQACPTAGSADGCSPGSSACFDPSAGSNYCVDLCTGTGQGTCRSGYACTGIGPVRGCVPAP